MAFSDSTLDMKLIKHIILRASNANDFRSDYIQIKLPLIEKIINKIFYLGFEWRELRIKLKIKDK